jgi:hypothetical protein
VYRSRTVKLAALEVLAPGGLILLAAFQVAPARTALAVPVSASIATVEPSRRSDAGGWLPLLRGRCPLRGGPFVVGLNHSREEGTMKYALLIYSSPELRDIPEDQLKSVIGEYEAISEAPEVLDGMQLQGTESATTVRVQNGEALLSDGPFVDAKEFIGGLYLLEADNLDAATALAARVPAARMGGAVEVRPIVER